MKKIKFAAFDVDGTTLPFKALEFSENTVKAFHELKEKNIKTILATGREFVTIGNLLNQVGNIDYFIGANGAFIYDLKHDTMLFESPIYYKDFEIFYEKMLPHVDSISVMDRRFGHVSENTDVDTWFLKPHQEKLKEMDFSNLDRRHLHIITVSTMRSDARKIANKIIKENNLNLSVQSQWYSGLFIAAKGINKSNALKWLMTYEGTSLDRLIAFGDATNDIEMIRDAGIGVAMKKADDGLHEIAKYIAPSCEEDGVYHQLKELEII